MKKLGLGVVVLIIISAIYYFTTGAAQLTAQMKIKLNSELLVLQKEGFSIQERKEEEKGDHFLLSFDEPEKIAQYFTHQGMPLSANDAAMLQGLKIGVDVTYLADTYSAISLDMYPVALPTAVASSLQEPENKILLADFQKMLDTKAFLIHVALNKAGTGFKGNMKDIDEVFVGETEVKFSMKGLTFSGDLENEILHGVTQNLEHLSINVQDELEMKLTQLTSHYAMTGDTVYDYTTDYTIKNMELSEKDQDTILIADTLMKSASTVKNGLASGSISVKSKNIDVTSEGKKFAFDTFTFDLKADNLDMSALEKLQAADITNETEVNALLQQLISKGITVEIPAFSIAKIVAEGEKMGGFNITSKVKIDKSLNLQSLETNPMSAINAIDINLNMTLSNELFALISQQPEAMMTMMLVQPKTVNDNKVYKIELKNGKLTVNDAPIGN